MHLLYRILIMMKWLGLIGIIGDISGNPVLKRFWLFFLLGFLEFHNLPVAFQSVKQLLSFPVMRIKYRRLPSAEDYHGTVDYQLPFEGEWYIVNGGIDRKTSHSWSIWPQRYAYDFFITDGENKSCSGDRTKLENYYCYGKNILAPADGEVVRIKNNNPNSKVYGDGTVICKAGDLRGNFITIRHNENEYSTIAHIMPGSITVKEGQRVTKGQVIAKCGNSGNTSEPHIHFQLNQGVSFFASAGLPIRFTGIDLTEDNELMESGYLTKGRHVRNHEG